MTLRLKSVLAIFLLLSFFLPILSSTHLVPEDAEQFKNTQGEEVVYGEKTFKKVVNYIEYPYKKAKNRTVFHTITFVIAFTWPWLILLFYIYVKKNVVRASLKYIELVLFSWTVFIVWIVIAFGSFKAAGYGSVAHASGGYFALTFILGYGVILIYEVIKDLYLFYKRSQT